MDEKNPKPVTPDSDSEIAPEHREYLLQRHGTFELDPVPAMDDEDPYNWPARKVLLRLYIYQLIYITYTPGNLGRLTLVHRNTSTSSSSRSML
jgi:hypothetical protein